MRSVIIAGAIAAAALLAGCSYDYLQHSDRVAYSAGDAVKHNLAQETVNPSSKSMYDKRGLGQNGPLADASSAEARAPGN